MIGTAKTLQKKFKEQHDLAVSWDEDPLLHTILEILGGPLNDDNYRTCKAEDAKGIINDKLSGISLFVNPKKLGRILRKVNKCETTTEIVLYMGEILLSD